MEIKEAIALISINATLIFQLISFLIFMVLIHRVMIRPLKRLMAERTGMIGQIEQDIVSAQDELKNIELEMAHQDRAARESAFEIRGQIEDEGKQAASEMIAKTKEEIDRLKDQAQRQAADQIAEAKKEITAAAATIGDQIVARLLGRNVGKTYDTAKN